MVLPSIAVTVAANDRCADYSCGAMVDPRRHAAALLAAVLLLPVPVPAFAQDPAATPEPLSGELPETNGEEKEPADTESTEPLADTGLEAGLVALLGLGLIASGGGLRVSLRAHGQR
jgi:hypothetical protein